MAENRNAQQVREITDKLEQGIKELFESEKFKEYLTTMSKFYNYSFNNTLLIAMQKPDATLIAGYTAWQRNFERQVMKGEKGIKILAPAPYKAQEEREKIDPATQKPVLDADGKPVTETVEALRPAFKVVSVFDVSQTDGKELPDITVDELTGCVENYAAFFEALRQESPVPISFEDIPGGAKGYFSHVENRIAIQEGMSEIQMVKTAIHEIAHAKLHAINPDEKVAPEERKDRHTKEVEAESVAYTVCQRYVLANTVQHNLHDGRYHAETKDWAGGISICDDDSSSFIVSQVHPGLVNLFINQFRDLLPEKEQIEAAPTPETEKTDAPKQRRASKADQEKPSIREQLKAAKAQPEKKSPAKEKKPKLAISNVYDGFDEHTVDLLRQEIMPVDRMPDDSISVDEMKEYGYSWGGMLPMREEAAAKVMQSCTVYRLYGDNTEGMVMDASELKAHAAQGGIFGVEKVEWIAALERENPLKAAEMSMGDDYGMIDGIINNGSKEDKSAEKAEKSSIMDRLKASKSEPPKEKPVPHKERKGDLEI